MTTSIEQISSVFEQVNIWFQRRPVIQRENNPENIARCILDECGELQEAADKTCGTLRENAKVLEEVADLIFYLLQVIPKDQIDLVTTTSYLLRSDAPKPPVEIAHLYTAATDLAASPYSFENAFKLFELTLLFCIDHDIDIIPVLDIKTLHNAVKYEEEHFQGNNDYPSGRALVRKQAQKERLKEIFLYPLLQTRIINAT